VISIRFVGVPPAVGVVKDVCVAAGALTSTGTIEAAVPVVEAVAYFLTRRQIEVRVVKPLPLPPQLIDSKFTEPPVDAAMKSIASTSVLAVPLVVKLPGVANPST
jgi:hypothetical protein